MNRAPFSDESMSSGALDSSLDIPCYPKVFDSRQVFSQEVGQSCARRREHPQHEFVHPLAGVLRDRDHERDAPACSVANGKLNSLIGPFRQLTARGPHKEVLPAIG